ncbi:GH92 family glycosyl hydrolase [Allonocardiopsis opalescens]|uniref:GH92 family glycosyl hydrolase n=1 Tax=Allonocardiopsis opalescens TaxID=1144618 RepID=UPI001B80C62F|nr:GH92 family glycosyl hydrolase [Allonocardiopsis opalescens]
MLTALGVVVPLLALAPPAAAEPLPDGTGAAGPAGGTEFATSFEADEQPPTWTDTVETGPDGTESADGVNGGDPSRIPGDVSDQVTAVTASDENTEGGEVAANLVDASTSSKWLAWEPTGWVTFEFAEPVAVRRYALTSANDAPDRDPADWTLSGSADGQQWTELDARSGEEFAERFETRVFDTGGDDAYRFYRLDVTANAGAPLLQLAELQFSDGSDAPPPPVMASRVGRGPTAGHTARPGAGYSGLAALRYQGIHTADGRGYSYNRVFDVDIEVQPDTELSYLVFPEFVTGDLNYPSTYVSVDLAFTDGSYLSELGARDHLGYELSPRGQGESHALYADQWNRRSSVIGEVAAGRTVDRVLIAYDAPTGPTSFRGWFDDIRITGEPERPEYGSLTDYVSTTRGTHSTGGFSRGNNFPATAVPHGFNFWTPVTDAGSTSWLYSYHRDNNEQNRPELQAFSVSHEPSPWMGDRQTFQVMPSDAAGEPDPDREARALSFDHANETARPHHYGVEFDNGIRTDIAPTDHAALFRFTFTGDTGTLLFDNVNDQGGLSLDPESGVVTGYSDVRSGLSAGATRLFVYAELDRPVTASGMLPESGRENVTGYLRLDTGAERTVNMRIATSLISVDQARRNLEQEIAPGDTFESVRDRAQAAWEDTLDVIEVEGASEDQLVTLYSNLYRLFLYPNSGHENTGTVEDPVHRYASPVSEPVGEDTPTETGARIVDGEIYVNNGFWDTYRTTWPAYALLTPERAGRMIDGFVQQYRDGGWISRWSSPGYANLMVGTSSDVAFADAFLKGVDNFDLEAAYDAAVRNATVTPPDDSVGRKGLASSIFLGYTPTSTPEGMSWALEGYINDFGIANMARELYERAEPGDPRREEYLTDYEYFTNRAQNYVNMFDPSVGFFQGRDADGNWRRSPEEYDPRVWGHDYTETNGWNMAFTVPQDGRGLANLYGGADGLGARLDEFFATPETATFPGSYNGVIHEMLEARDVRMGQLGHSNQPSHHIPYMYTFAGQPHRTQEIVRELLARTYSGSEIGQGYAGDEDNGEMSAWYIFSALGLYPLQMGSPEYAIGSPLFTRATVHLENGADLVIEAPGNSAENVYVQGVRVNGAEHTSTSLPHELIAEGGVIEFDMGPEPSDWGTGADAAPPSLTEGDAPPSPMRDITADGTTTAAEADGTEVDAAPLVDDRSTTDAAFAGPAFTVTHQAGDRAERPEYYTLTSGEAEGDPASWRLHGSYDGTTWSVIDERSGEEFRWRRQTRPFRIEAPGRYTHYRLEVTAASGETAALSEFELLAAPQTACTETVTGAHRGALTVAEGVTCLDAAQVSGAVRVEPGASLRVEGGALRGTLTAEGAAEIVLTGAELTGGVRLSGGTGPVALEGNRITGPVRLTGNTGGPTTVAANTIDGGLSCSGNEPEPVGNGFPNTGRGAREGQCAEL